MLQAVYSDTAQVISTTTTSSTETRPCFNFDRVFATVTLSYDRDTATFHSDILIYKGCPINLYKAAY